MRKEIVVHAERELTHIAILEEGRLAELYIENPQHERTIGNIYLGRVKKVMPSIKAAFVDVGLGQDAFLHYSDLTDNLPDWIDFLKDPNQTVGDRKPTTARPKNRRRRPSSKRPQGRQGSEAKGDGEKSGERGEGRLGKNSRARGQRRSQQRRRNPQPKQQNGKSSRGGSSSGKPERSDAHPSTYLDRDQTLLVKITKEPISTKGSRVSTDISLAGRFLVLVPLADYVAVSKKISSYKERRRLKALAKSLAPEGFGVIVRTVAEGKSVRMLDTDLRLLVEKWRRIERKIQQAKRPPALCYEDVSMVSSIMRDLFSDDYDRILVDDANLFRNLQNYVNAIAPEMSEAVQQYEGRKPIFEHVKVKRDLEEAFSRRVDLPSGGYLFIEHTEAMHVVDVNSGRARHRGASQEENALRVNLESARAIARHLRLRDLGGIIVVDFIDLRDDRKRRKVYEELKREFKKDRAVTKLLPMSDFGLIQITRQRIRPSITTTMEAPNEDGEIREGQPQSGREAARSGRDAGDRSSRRAEEREREEAADRSDRREDARRGTAKPEPAAPAPRTSRTPKELVDELDAWIGRFRAEKQRGPLHLHVHPFTAAYLTSRVPNQPTRWLMRHFTRIRVKPTHTLDPLSYRFVNPKSGEDLTQTFAQKLLKAAPTEPTPPAASDAPEASASPERSKPRSTGNADASAISSRDETRSRSGGRPSRSGEDGETDSRGGSSKSGSARGRGSKSRSKSADSQSSDSDSRSSSGRSSSNRNSSSRSSEKRSSSGRDDRSRRQKPTDAETVAEDAQTSSAESETAENSERSSRSRNSRSRGGRGGRGRSRSSNKPATDDAQDARGTKPDENAEAKPTSTRSRRSAPKRSEASDETDEAKDEPRAEAKPKRSPRSKPRQTDDAPKPDDAASAETAEQSDSDAPQDEAKPKRPSRRGRSRRSDAPDASADDPKPSAEPSEAEETAAPKKRGTTRRASSKPKADEAKSEASPSADAAPKPKAKPKPRVSGDRRFMKIDLTSRPSSPPSDPDA